MNGVGKFVRVFSAALAVACSISIGLLFTATARADDKVGPLWGLELVLQHVAERKYSLPKGDFILLSVQPVGIVSETIVYDFGAREVVEIPGTHSDDDPITRMPLSPEKITLLKDVMALPGVRSIRRDESKLGLDGSTFAAVIKIGGRERRIDQWGGDAPGLELLEAIHDREVVAFMHERNRRANAKRREQDGM